MTKFELPEKPNKTNTSEDFNNLRKAVDELDKFDYAWKTYANKADRRINAANKHIEELERENQQLVAENLDVKTLIYSAKPQQALPVVPECVAEIVELLKKNPETPWSKLCGSLGEEGVNWLNEFQHKDERFGIGELNNKLFVLFHLAINGYQVEKPQLFYIALPKIYGLSDSVFVSKIENRTILEFIKGKDYALKLTEQEIKSIDERYWQFAVPVEDGE